jgi:hypothetical protein
MRARPPIRGRGASSLWPISARRRTDWTAMDVCHHANSAASLHVACHTRDGAIHATRPPPRHIAELPEALRGQLTGAEISSSFGAIDVIGCAAFDPEV